MYIAVAQYTENAKYTTTEHHSILIELGVFINNNNKCNFNTAIKQKLIPSSVIKTRRTSKTEEETKLLKITLHKTAHYLLTFENKVGKHYENRLTSIQFLSFTF